MIYNKTEKRVLQYVELLQERMFSPIPVKLKVKEQQFAEYTNTAVSDKKLVTGYPFSFGKEGEDSKFSFDIEVPEEGDILLRFPLGTDSLVCINGVPECNINPFHEIMNISKWKGQKISVLITAWDGHIFPGWKPINDSRLLTIVDGRQRDYPITLKKPEILRKNPNNYELWYDLTVLTETALEKDSNDYYRQIVFSRLHDSLMNINLSEDDESVWESQAASVLKETKALLALKNGSLAPEVLSVGMAHIDHAWLWAKKETHRKAVRTIAGMLHLMDEYPDFVFLSTQPVQMDDVFREYPVLKERALKMYKKGQFEPNGVGLVEPDNVLSSGEGLIRNLVYGRETTEKYFPGYKADSYVLPDSFGYNGNLPQILAGCGVKYFVTSKLSWNDTNRFPFDTFIWKGIDGTEIKAHMVQGSYNGTNNPKQIISMWNGIVNKDVQSSLLRTIGEGDGGGGTTRDDNELIKRLENLQGCPKTHWTSVSKAMDRVFETSRNIPTYDGELYFELHRGTYTSQAKMKQGYRQTVTLLHNVEYLLCYLWAKHEIGKDIFEKTKNRIKEIWKEVVINQFHDILPGSCVGCVYDEVNSFYSEAIKEISAMIKSFVSGKGKKLNLTPFTVDGIAPYSSGLQKQSDCNWGTLKISECGEISSLTYHGKELVSKPWNSLMFGEDLPLNWDAWDVEKDSMNKLTPFTLPADNFERKGKIGNASTIKQKIVVHKECARIDFITDVDWHENHKMLRAEFPTTLRTDFAVFDIQYGFVSRSTKNNNSFEQAQFESPAQKFVMLNDGYTSIAIISDSKYGFSAKNNTIGISLLRSPKAPDANADMGKHHFTYSVFISDGDIVDTIKEAEIINNPLIDTCLDFEPMIKVSDNVALDWVKPSEDGKSIVFRVREIRGVNTAATFEIDDCLDKKTLTLTNMLEKPVKGSKTAFHPFEVKTFSININ